MKLLLAVLAAASCILTQYIQPDMVVQTLPKRVTIILPGYEESAQVQETSHRYLQVAEEDISQTEPDKIENSAESEEIEKIRQQQFADLFRNLSFIQPMYEGQWNIQDKLINNSTDNTNQVMQQVWDIEDEKDYSTGKSRVSFRIASGSLSESSSQAAAAFWASGAQREPTTNSKNSSEPADYVLEMHIVVFMGQHRDKEMDIQMSLQTAKCKESEVSINQIDEGIFKITNIPATVMQKNKLRAEREQETKLDLTLRSIISDEMRERASGLYTKKNFDMLEYQLEMDLDFAITEEAGQTSLWSENKVKGFQFMVKQQPIDLFTQKVGNYSFILTSLIVSTFFVTLNAIKMATENQAIARSISIVTLGTSLLWNFFYFTLHFQIGLSHDYMQYASLPGFWFFIASFTFQSRLFIQAWRSQLTQQQLYDETFMRKRLTFFYCAFYIGCFTFTIFQQFFLFSKLGIFLFNTTLWIPQIVKNYIYKQKKTTRIEFAICMQVVQSFLPIYLKTCPKNILEVKWEPVFGYCMIVWILFQMVVMHLQQKWHPRWFVPKRFRRSRNQFNYYQDVVPLTKLKKKKGDEALETSDEAEMGAEENMCVICMNSIHYEVDEHGNLVIPNQPSKPSDGRAQSHMPVAETDLTTERTNDCDEENPDDELQEEQAVPQLAKKFMRTPCKHDYHLVCLRKWMDVRLECPTCRQQLPPDDDDD